jgi:hypothetical protein
MDPDKAHEHLHYTSPASGWAEALPIGNGRLGCMVYGRTATELLRLNEDSVWYGGPQDRTPQCSQHLPRLREHIREGRPFEAEQLVREEFFANPASMRHYEPLGSAYLDFGLGEADKVHGYKRWLDIGRAVSTVTYKVNDVQVQRDMIASYPDNALILCITSSRAIPFTVQLTRRSENEWDTNEFLDSVVVREGESPGHGSLVMHATPGGQDSNRLCCVLGVRCRPGSGTVEGANTRLKVISSDCIVAIGAHTTYRHADPQLAALADVSAALKMPWTEILSRHLHDYQHLFSRAGLRLWPDHSHIPTNERIAERAVEDVGLVALYYHYGRYLLLSSSRDGPQALPANLQGIWNHSFSPAWGSKFTININTQMNYWPAAPSGLLECALPLVDLLERMASRGRRTAQLMYQCSGWCAHHNTDIWADTDPQDTWMPATIWPLGGVWLCVEVVQMLQVRHDRSLHQRLWPILEGCVQFLGDFLVPAADGKHLVTNPSLSPENTYVSRSREPGIFCEGSAMDMAIVRTAFELYLWSADLLGHGGQMQSQVEAMLAKILPLQVNKDGLIQEWGLEDYEEQEPGHRHVSHLFDLYPGHLISPERTPELAESARRVLERRAAHGGGHTGWSRAWLLNMHARLGDADGCGKHMELLLSRSTLPNLLDNHPPFQIDGNFGGCAGIVECLVQSKQESGTLRIWLLPSCPGIWSKGRLAGIRVRGGWAVSFEWDQGQIIDPVRVLSPAQDGAIRAQVIYPGGESVQVIKVIGEQRIGRR